MIGAIITVMSSCSARFIPGESENLCIDIIMKLSIQRKWDKTAMACSSGAFARAPNVPPTSPRESDWLTPACSRSAMELL